MKQAYMIYTEAEGQKNHAFIKMFQRAGESHNLLFSFVPLTQYQQMPLPDLVLNRSRNPEVSRWYEERQIRVYHDSDIVKIGNDKYQTLQRLQERLPEDVVAATWCPRSFLLTAEMVNDLHLLQQQIKQKLGTEDAVVLKTVDGHGGSEVYRLSANPLRDALHWRQILDCLRGRHLLCQSWVDCDSRDLRVYILWGEIYAAVLRQGQDDFRSNYSRGGSVRQYDLSEQERAYIQPFIQALGGKRLAMAGIDFLLRRDGMLLFNELEEMVGCRMLYQCTERDIVQDYISMMAQDEIGFKLVTSC